MPNSPPAPSFYLEHTDSRQSRVSMWSWCTNEDCYKYRSSCPVSYLPSTDSVVVNILYHLPRYTLRHPPREIRQHLQRQIDLCPILSAPSLPSSSFTNRPYAHISRNSPLHPLSHVPRTNLHLIQILTEPQEMLLHFLPYRGLFSLGIYGRHGCELVRRRRWRWGGKVRIQGLGHGRRCGR